MQREALEKLYADLPSSCRERWDFARFSHLANEKMTPACDFEVHRASAKLSLPRELEEMEFGGIASAFDTRIDTWMPTYIEQGAFKNTLQNEAERNRVKVHYEHSLVIGKPTYMAETPKGLVVIGKVSNTSLGKDVMTLMRDGAIDEMSIGFEPVEYFFREDKASKEMCRHITEARLHEFSPVSRGANRGAKITVVNSMLGVDLEQLTAQLAPALYDRLKGMFAQQATAPKIDETNADALRAEIERLTALLPKPTGATTEELALLQAIEGSL